MQPGSSDWQIVVDTIMSPTDVHVQSQECVNMLSYMAKGNEVVSQLASR